MKDERTKLRKNKDNLDAFGFVVILVGMGIIFLGLLTIIGLQNVVDEKHLSNPDMPYQDYPENATYSWTYSEIMDEVFNTYYFSGIGILLLVIGGGCVILNTSRKTLHELECSRYQCGKYCSDCGLKLSRLE